MATAKKKAPAKAKARRKAPAKAKRKAPAKARRKAPAKKSTARKAAASKPAKGNVFQEVIKDALGELDQWVDTARLKAKQLAAEEKIIERKAELAVRTEIDRAKHLADQAEKWTRARIKSDAKKLDALEKKLTRQLRQVERKLRSQARAVERKASKQGNALKRRIEAETKKAFGKKAPARKKAPAKKKSAAPKRKTAARKTKARARR